MHKVFNIGMFDPEGPFTGTMVPLVVLVGSIMALVVFLIVRPRRRAPCSAAASPYYLHDEESLPGPKFVGVVATRASSAGHGSTHTGSLQSQKHPRPYRGVADQGLTRLLAAPAPTPTRTRTGTVFDDPDDDDDDGMEREKNTKRRLKSRTVTSIAPVHKLVMKDDPAYTEEEVVSSLLSVIGEPTITSKGAKLAYEICCKTGRATIMTGHQEAIEFYMQNLARSDPPVYCTCEPDHIGD